MGRIHVTIAVVALLLLAGCSGIGGGGSGGDGGASTDSTVYPDGYDETGVVDADAAVEAHRSASENAAGVNANLEATESGEQERSLTQRQTINHENGMYLSRSTAGPSTQISYRTEEGVVYTRQERGDSVRYRRDDSGIGTPGLDIGNAVGLLEDIEMQSTTEQRDGTTLIGYELDGSQESEFGNQTVTIEEASLTIDEEGKIRSLSAVATRENGGEVTIDAAFEYGEFTVQEPDWFDQAQQATEEDGGDDF